MRAVLAAVVCALVAFACLNVGVARAADAQTHSIAGLNYTLPADWEQLVSADDLTGLDQVEELDIDLSSVSDLVVWGKGDGVFAALAIEGDTSELPALSELEAVATYAEFSLAGSPFEGIEFVAATDQGCPAIAAYSDAITFNSETYAVTAELFAVDNASFTGIVAMMSFLPASGTVNEDASSLVELLDQDVTVAVGDFTYTVPAGSYLVQGNVFAMEYAFAFDPDGDEGGLAWALNVPVELGVSLTAADLQELADELNAAFDQGVDQSIDESLAQTGLDVSIADVWAGAYTWLGLPTIGFECTADGGGDPEYFGAMVSLADDAIEVLLVVQPDGSSYVANLLDGAASTAEPAASSAGSFAVGGASDAEVEAGEPEADTPGFVVGFTAADGAR